MGIGKKIVKGRENRQILTTMILLDREKDRGYKRQGETETERQRMQERERQTETERQTMLERERKINTKTDIKDRQKQKDT